MRDYPKTIIHADDDPLIQGLVQRALGDDPKVHLSFCNNGRELIEAVTTNPPDLVLLDLSMPEMNGLEALRNLHKNPAFHDVLIVLMTGHRTLKMHDDFKALNIIGIIHKPFSPGMLPERIRYFWHFHHTGEDIEIHSRM